MIQFSSCQNAPCMNCGCPARITDNSANSYTLLFCAAKRFRSFPELWHNSILLSMRYKFRKICTFAYNVSDITNKILCIA